MNILFQKTLDAIMGKKTKKKSVAEIDGKQTMQNATGWFVKTSVDGFWHKVDVKKKLGKFLIDNTLFSTYDENLKLVPSEYCLAKDTDGNNIIVEILGLGNFKLMKNATWIHVK